MARNTALRFVVLLTAFLVVGAGGARAEEGGNAASIEGAWFCTILWAPWWGGGPSEMLLSAGPGGTVMTADSDDLTGFNPTLAANGFVVQMAGFGGWKRTRGHEFDLNYLPLTFTGVGAEIGLNLGLGRFRCAVEVRGDLMNGACDFDFWYSTDPDGDGLPDSPNPVTTAPDVALSDVTELACNRIPVVPKQ